MSNTPTLIAYSGPYDGTRYPLREGTMMLGTHLASDIQVEWDATVSRRHARIEGVAGLFWLVDLESKNGSFLWREDSSEERLETNQPTLLVDGKWLRLGKYACFQVVGLVKSDEEALRQLFKQLKERLANLYQGLSFLSNAMKEKQLQRILEFERLLDEVKDNDEAILHLAAKQLTTLGVEENHAVSPNDNPEQDELKVTEQNEGWLAWEEVVNAEDPRRISTPYNILSGALKPFIDKLEQGGASEPTT